MPTPDPNPAAPAGNRTSNEADEHQAKTGGGRYAPRYRAATAARPYAEPLRMTVELVVVTGPSAEALIKKQAAAVRDALRWFAEHPPERSD